jgi:tetratricopeptide (TPR) repeat protein
MHDLGVCLARLGRQAEAEGLFRESLVMSRKLLPRESNRLSLAIKDMAAVLEDLGKLAEEEPLRRELVDLGRMDQSRQKHEPGSLEERIFDLADNLYSQGKLSEAEPFYRELAQRRSRRLPATHDDVLDAKSSLARVLSDWAWMDCSNLTVASRSSERAAEAEKILRECLDVRLQGTNTGHWRVSDVRSRLGGAMLSVAVTDRSLTDEARKERYPAIETLLLQGHEGIMLRNSPGSKRKRGTFERLIRLYEAWGKPAAAAEWRKKLAAFEEARRAKKIPADDPER